MLDRYTKMHIEIQEVWLDVMEFLSLVWKCLSIIVKRDQYAPVWKGIPARHPLRDWRFIIEAQDTCKSQISICFSLQT